MSYPDNYPYDQIVYDEEIANHPAGIRWFDELYEREFTEEDCSKFAHWMTVERNHPVSMGMAKILLEAGHTGKLQQIYKKLYNPGEEFEYAVGRPRKEGGGVGFYTYHNEIHRGTIKDAESFLKYVEGKNEKKDQPYRIYRVVELTDEDKDKLRNGNQ